MSFFDEDDEPPRTARTRVRPSPPRRGRVTSGGPSDAQTLLVRRMIAGIVGVAGPPPAVLPRPRLQQHAPRERAAGLQPAGHGDRHRVPADRRASSSRRSARPARRSPTDLYQSILALSGSADQSLKQAQALSVPGDMARAQQSLLIALELRRDGLQAISDNIKNALGDKGDNADAAIKNIAGQMQRVQRVRRALQGARRSRSSRTALDRTPACDGTISPSQFLKEISWVSPDVRRAEARDAALGQHRHRHGHDEEAADRSRPARHRPQQHVLRQRHAAARRVQPAHLRQGPAVHRQRSPTRATTTSSTSRSR